MTPAIPEGASEIRFGNYRTTATLSSGSLSTIYKAVQEPIGRVVAIKALRTQIASTSSFAEQLDREAKILADLAHPNIVLLLDVGRSTAARPYVVLEYVDGPSLETLITNKKKLPVAVALAIACGIAAALEHVHERGVIHRDVKPSNVLFTKGGVVKIVDFGIAQRARMGSVSDAFADAITPSGRMAPESIKDAFGTPAYMSPEQILGDFVDGRSDLFSLGVVLYQMLSGSRPFEAPGRSAAQRIRRDTPDKLGDRAPDVPRVVERLVMRLLEKAPQDRFASAAAVRERLETALRAETREDPASIIRSVIGDGGGSTSPKINDPSIERSPRVSVRRALAGQAIVLAVFLGGILAVEGASCAGRDAGHAPSGRLELAPARAGGLRVVATPWANVKVDGQDVETTPFAHAIPLAPGTHWITLTHPDSASIEREVNVAPGEIVTLDVTMQSADVVDAGKDVR